MRGDNLRLPVPEQIVDQTDIAHTRHIEHVGLVSTPATAELSLVLTSKVGYA